jgi:hypothetical protein
MLLADGAGTLARGLWQSLATSAKTWAHSFDKLAA